MRMMIVAASAALALASSQAANAQSLKEKIVGAYTLAEGSEVFADGKKVVPWAKGSLQVSPAGRLSFFVFPKERAKTDSVRTPAGPMVSYYGSYVVDEGAKTVTVTIEGASSPAFEGAKRLQTVTFQADSMTWTGSKVPTPEGEITPVNVWKKVTAK